MGAPFLPRRQQVIIRIESVEGTAETLTAGDVIAPILEAEWTPDITMAERNVLASSLSPLAQLSAEQFASITFATDLKAAGGSSGLVPPNLSAAFRGCGMSETISLTVSVTYQPISQDFESVTIEIREGSVGADAKIKQIVGARGSFILEAEKGGLPLVRFTFQGRYIEPTDGSLFADAASGPTPQPFLGVSFDFQGVTTLKLRVVNIDIGNSVSPRNDINQASGNFSAVITDRNPTATIDPEQELISTINYFNKLTQNTEGNLSYIIGSGVGLVVTVAAPKAQIIGIAEGERDDFRIEDIDLQLNKSAAAGDDELTIVFT